MLIETQPRHLHFEDVLPSLSGERLDPGLPLQTMEDPGCFVEDAHGLFVNLFLNEQLLLIASEVPTIPARSLSSPNAQSVPVLLMENSTRYEPQDIFVTENEVSDTDQFEFRGAC
jgi:hypothetical protein